MGMNGYSTFMIGFKLEGLNLSEVDKENLIVFYENDEHEVKLRFSDPEGDYVGIIINEDDSDEAVAGMDITVIDVSEINKLISKVVDEIYYDLKIFIPYYIVKIVVGNFYRWLNVF